MVDMHLHLGCSRDGARLTALEIQKAMERYRIERAVVFGIDEPDAGPTYQRTNDRVLKAVSGNPRLIGFMRLNPRAGEAAAHEFHRLCRAGMRGVKLHPRSEKFSPERAENLIAEIETQRLPIILHTSHEKNCTPLAWRHVFKRHRKIPFVLAHAGKDAFQEAIAVAKEFHNLWLETSALSYWRTAVILKKLGASRVVFGSDLPYSHPALERMKLDFLLSASERRKVYSENPKRILAN